MHDLPTDWSALCTIVFLLGMRHGFDADHLATIDGFTRISARSGRVYSRYCGLLFSVGHGAVVLGIAIAVGLLSEHWVAPPWLDSLGNWVSIGFLLLLGIINLQAVLLAEPGRPVTLVGIKGRVIGKILHANSATSVAAVGALFALSFDTVSQATLFAATAAQYGGVAHSVSLGLLFVLGMIATDGLNGWWISRLIARADQMAAMASRIMGVAVAGVSLLVAGIGIGKLASPLFDTWSDGKELAFGALVVCVMAASYLVANLCAGKRLRSPVKT